MCLLSADWGNVADWAAVVVAAGAALAAIVVGLIAAIATFSAVFVAMKTSRDGIAEARRIRDEEARDAERSVQEARKHEGEVQRLRTIARAVTFDFELFQLGGMLHEIRTQLYSGRFGDNSITALRFVTDEIPKDQLSMLTRFAGEVDAFGVDGASKLLIALSTWSNFKVAPSHQSISAHTRPEADLLLARIKDALETQLKLLREAREVTRDWAAHVRTNAPATYW